MIRKTVIYFFFIISSAISMLTIVKWKAGPSTKGPMYQQKSLTKIFIKKKKINLGKVNSLDQAKETFYVRNVGRDTLYIENIEVSCNCTALSGVGEHVLPGDSIPITIAYTKNRPGFFYSDILIYGNFYNSPALLSFEGHLLIENRQIIP